ncbi:RNA helicase [Bifidobacterium callitrichos]|nr:RNA helicase [Bifidobacterium callitrichos]
MTGNPIVDSDEQVRALNKRIGDLYSSYYTAESSRPCRFDEFRERRDRSLMLRLLHELNERLRAINDGSFIVDDRETGRVSAL